MPRSLLSAVLFVATAACAPARVVHEATPVELGGTRWIVERIDGRPPVAGTVPSLHLRAASVTGFGGCNDFGGLYESVQPLRFSELVMTVALCTDAIARQEDALLQAAGAVRAARIDGDRLHLLDATGRERLQLARRAPLPGEGAPLAGTRWRLAGLDGQPVAAPMHVRLAFDDTGHYRRQAGCEVVRGTYVADDGRIDFTSGEFDRGGCRDGDDAAEAPRTPFRLFHRVEQYGVHAGRLTMIAPNGHRAVFERDHAPSAPEAAHGR